MFVLRVHRVVACVAGSSFRASRLGLHRCWQGLGVCGWMLKFVCFFGRVAWLPASREARLGRRFSDCVFVSRFGGVWVYVKICFLLGCVVRLPASWEARLGRRVSDCVVASKVWGRVGGC